MEAEHFIRITFNIAEMHNDMRNRNRDSFLLKLLQAQGCPISFNQKGEFFIPNGKLIEGTNHQGKGYVEVKWKPDLNQFLQGVEFCNEQPALAGAPTLAEKPTIKDVTPLEGELICN
jgi:hypothetical protein